MVSGAGGRYPFHRVARRGHILQAGIDELSEARQRLSRLAEQVLRTQNRWFEAISEYEAALASNPNFVVALNGLDWRKLHAGLLDEVTPLAQQALRRSPRRPPDRCLVQRCRDGASAAIGHRRGDRLARKSAQRRPAKPFNHINLTAAYALSGDMDRAAAELTEARRLRGEGSFSSIARMKGGGWWGSLLPKTRALFEAPYFAGLRKAGMPEE